MSRIVAEAREGVEVEELTLEESLAMLDKHARELLGMSGVDFIRRYRAGELPADEETHDAVIRLSMLIPDGA